MPAQAKGSGKNHQDSPELPNNFSAKKPNDDKAPKIGGSSFGPSPNSHQRGKDGTQG